jgi:aminopeptidase N
MRTDTAQPVRLSDYRPPDYLIDTVHLDVRLHDTATRVVAKLALRPNPAGRAGAALALDGDELTVKSVRLDGAALDLATTATPQKLTIAAPPAGPFTLEIETEIKLMGLYRSNGTYCTQCEAEGFRRITYFSTGPTCWRLHDAHRGEKRRGAGAAVNGNPSSAGELDGGRISPSGTTRIPKPSYLFALVGGDLGRWSTRSSPCPAARSRSDLCRARQGGRAPPMRWTR